MAEKFWRQTNYCTLQVYEIYYIIIPHIDIFILISGGCGRTGTYIAMCLLIDRLKTEGVVDVFQTVRGLRLQRPGMVRTVVCQL